MKIQARQCVIAIYKVKKWLGGDLLADFQVAQFLARVLQTQLDLAYLSARVLELHSKLEFRPTENTFSGN